MRIIRPVLPIVLLALALAGCAGSTTILSTVGAPVGDATGQGAGAAKPIAAPSAGSATGETIGARDDAKIIRTGTIALEVRDVPTAVRAARDAVVAAGGYVGASTTSNVGDRPTAEITYRILVDRWESTLDTLRSLNGQTTKVVSEHTEAVEVTGQVADLEARIRNLQASEVALQGIAAKATKVSDILEVQAQLTDVRGQIEQLTAQLKDLNDRAAYATLAVTYNVPVVAVEVAARSWDPKTAVDEAAATMLAILQNLATAGIWFAIVWLPIFLVLGLVIAVVVRVLWRFGFRTKSPGDVPPAPPIAPAGTPPTGPLPTEGEGQTHRRPGRRLPGRLVSSRARVSARRSPSCPRSRRHAPTRSPGAPGRASTARATRR